MEFIKIPPPISFKGDKYLIGVLDQKRREKRIGTPQTTNGVQDA
jgi:hypothetical protein